MRRGRLGLARLGLLLGLLAGTGTPRGMAGQTTAESAWNAGDLDGAARLYAERLSVDSTDQRALHRLGLIHAWQGRHAEGLRLLEALVELRPGDLEARRDYARVLGWSGELDAAIRQLDPVITGRPEDPVALRARAQFRARAGDLEGAEADYRRLAALTDGERELQLERARLLSWMGRLQPAVRLYDSLVTADPDDVAAVEGLARVAGWRGKLRLSEAMWRRALAIDSVRVPALLGLARTLRWQGRAPEGVRFVQRARRLEPGSAEVAEERRWTAGALASWISPEVAYETDTDENEIRTVGLRGGIRPAPRVELGWSAYGRRATNELLAPSSDSRIESGGGHLSLGLYLGEGWRLSGSGGATRTGGASGQTLSRWTAGLSTPGHLPVTFGLQVSRRPLDLTSQLIQNGAVMEELSASLAIAPAPGWRIRAGFAPARYEGRVTNDRLAGHFGIERRLARAWSIGARARAFGFDEDLNEGYFDPDFYGIVQAPLRWTLDVERWLVSLELAPGLQQVGSDGEVTGALNLEGRFAYRFSPGRELFVGSGFSSTGLQSFSTADADYRYGRVAGGLRWAF